MYKLLALMIGAVMSISVAGCDDEAAAPDDNLTALSGTVVSMRDDFPVDGGAEIQLRDDVDGQVKRAYLSSIFTSPPPDEETQATVARVMRVFHELDIGDHAVARGVPDEGGLRMKYLEAE